MKFTKIKSDGIETQLAWTTKLDGGGVVEHVLKSYDPPRPELLHAMRAFVPECLELLELDEAGWSPDDIAVIGFSINEEDDGRCGLVVTLKKKLAQTNAPLILNTPHMREHQGEPQTKGFLPEGMLSRLHKLEREAAAFVKGKRAQTDMFGGKDA